MNLLYIIATLVMDIVPNNPIGHPVLPPSTFPTHNPIINFQTRYMGIDERFPVGLYDANDFLKIAQLNDSFEKLQRVQNMGFIEDVKKDPLMNDILNTDEIARFQIKSGGLFDDWERNI
jgi:hypothetical protein